MDDFDPNEGFYRSLERESDTNNRISKLKADFSELCSRNNYTARYVIEHRRGKFQCTMKITDANNNNDVMYHLSSDIMTNENNVLLNVMAKIVRLSESIKRPGRINPPAVDTGNIYVPIRVEKMSDL